MTTNHHTPIPTSPKQPANAETFNAPLSELDAEVSAQDARIGVLESEMPNPSGVATEFYNGLGEFTVPAGTGASVEGHVIKDDGVSLPQRASIDFIGAGVTVTNEAGGTQIEIPGGVVFTATDKLLGRSSPGGGAGEEISLTAAGRALLDDADAAEQRATLGIANDGWIADGSTWSYSSVDSPTGVISVNSDMTAKLQKGYRLKFNQPQSLTAYFPFDANSNSSVGSFTSTPTNVSYTAGKFSNAGLFDGTTSKVVITDTALMKPTGDFTMGCWFKTSNAGAAKDLFQSYSGGASIAGFRFTVDITNVLRVQVGKNTGVSLNADFMIIYGKTTVTDGAWHYGVISYRNNLIQMYLDGNLEASSYCFTPAYAATNYVRIGCNNNTGTDGNFFNGQIDDLFLINGYALDERTIYNQYVANAAQGASDITITKNAIVTGVGTYSGGNTLITAYFGTDFSLTSGTITSPYYSNAKNPFGFNSNPAKWTILFVDNISRVQNPVTTNILYYLIAITIYGHIGAWIMSFGVEAFWQNTAASTDYSLRVGIAFPANTTQDVRFVKEYRARFASAASYVIVPFYVSDFVTFNTKTTIYPFISSTDVTTSLGYSGAIAPTQIKMVSAYL